MDDGCLSTLSAPLALAAWERTATACAGVLPTGSRAQAGRAMREIVLWSTATSTGATHAKLRALVMRHWRSCSIRTFPYERISSGRRQDNGELVQGICPPRFQGESGEC